MNKQFDFKAGEVLVFDKPLTWTSYNLVGKVKSLLRHLPEGKSIKVGHAGTLDPLASGLMVICTGKKTKEIDSFQQTKKEYIADITFGSTTPSYDLETGFDAYYETKEITAKKITDLLKTMEGEYMQHPPLFSAKKIDGKRAYKKARKGEKLVLDAVKITFFELELLGYEENIAKIRIVCSKGTYIRSFAHDIGKALNSGAHLSGLIRTKSGDFSLEDAYSVESFETEFRTYLTNLALA